MHLSMLGINLAIPEEDKYDSGGKYCPSIDYDDVVHPLFTKYNERIDKLIFISNSDWKIDRKQAAKVATRLAFDGDIIEIFDFDLTSKKFLKFYHIYSGYRNWLNIHVNSSDLQLLKEFYYLFPAPYREKIEFQELGSGFIANVDNKHDMNNLTKVVSELDDDSYLISWTNEDRLYYIFCKPKIIDIISSWER